MSQKSSLPQAVKSVSQALMSDSFFSDSKSAAGNEPKFARRKAKTCNASTSASSGDKSAEETVYSPLFANIAKAMCTNGIPLDEIAEAFQVEKITIDRWKRKHKEFADALELGVALANARVQRSLYQLAHGYDRTDVKIFRYKRRIIYAPYTVHVPANVNAAIFWLTNRMPDEWSPTRDVQRKKAR